MVCGACSQQRLLIGDVHKLETHGESAAGAERRQIEMVSPDGHVGGGGAGRANVPVAGCNWCGYERANGRVSRQVALEGTHEHQRGVSAARAG